MNTPEMMDLYGKKADGTEEFLGHVPMSPEMKIPDLVRSYGFNPDDLDEGSMVVGAMEDLIAWLKKQGWTPPPIIPADTQAGTEQTEAEKLAAAKSAAHRALDAAEKAWYEYAGLCDVGPDRIRAFDVYQNVRMARRL